MQAKRLCALLLCGFGCVTREDVRWFLNTCGLRRDLRLTARKEFGIVAAKGGESHAI